MEAARPAGCARRTVDSPNEDLGLDLSDGAAARCYGALVVDTVERLHPVGLQGKPT